MRIEQSSVNLSATSYSARLETRSSQVAVRFTAAESTALADDDELSMEWKYRVLQWFAESVFGRPIRLCRVASSCSSEPVAQQSIQVRVAERRTVMEAQQTTFQAKGTVVTADGREISFRAELSMSRQEVFVEQGAPANATDPLVLNFKGNARLTEDTVEFDLNSDGVVERMAGIDSSSGVLFIDRNADGTANDGSELFGPTTGNGFEELAGLDGDLNGWIDEGDAAFAQLRVWFQGEDSVRTLSELGVGAIYASSVATPFALDGGVIRSSGVYLNENGGAGTLQQVDLVTEPVA